MYAVPVMPLIRRDPGKTVICEAPQYHQNLKILADKVGSQSIKADFFGSHISKAELMMRSNISLTY